MQKHYCENVNTNTNNKQRINTMNNDYRKECERKDQLATEFLSCNFWAFHSNNFRYNNIPELSSLNIHGSDLTLSGTIHVDDKLKDGFDLDNLDDSCVGLEMNRLCKNGKRKNGWFVENNLTHLYSFNFVEWEDKAKTHIKRMKMLLISKKALKKWVSSVADVERLNEQAWDMACNPDDYRNYCGKVTSRRKGAEYWLTFSERYNEAPVNLVVPYKTLKQFGREFTI